MAENLIISGDSKAEKYEVLYKQIKELVGYETDEIANMANISSMIHETFGFLWTGFYRVVGEELVLGPFQGPLACTRIRRGKGVCGTAVRDRRVIRVEDVHEFPGHIACDAASASEIVVPLFKAHKVIGVLDIDSPHKGRFDEADEEGLKLAARTVQELVSMNG